MIIKTPKLTRKIIFLRKNGFKLYESDKFEKKKNIFPNILYKSSKTLEQKEQNDEDSNKIQKIKNLREFKKKLFLDNILSIEKNYFIEDYILQKESKLLKNKNPYNKYQLRKKIFSEKKIDTCRTSYFNKEARDNNNINKIPIMMKNKQISKEYKNKYKEIFSIKEYNSKNIKIKTISDYLNNIIFIKLNIIYKYNFNILLLSFIIIFCPIYLCKENKIKFLNLNSEITLIVKGTGEKNILSNSLDDSFQLPDKIYINNELQVHIDKTYNFSYEENKIDQEYKAKFKDAENIL